MNINNICIEFCLNLEYNIPNKSEAKINYDMIKNENFKLIKVGDDDIEK